jgi:hypothetical protein
VKAGTALYRPVVNPTAHLHDHYLDEQAGGVGAIAGQDVVHVVKSLTKGEREQREIWRLQ